MSSVPRGRYSSDSPWVKPEINEWESLFHLGRKAIYKRGAVLFIQGEPATCFYLLRRGRVKVSIYTEEGSEKILAILDDNSLIGESSALLGQPHNGTAVVLAESEIYSFPADEVLRLMQTSPELSVKLIKSLVTKIRLLTLQVENLSFLDAPTRITRMLAKVASLYGKAAGPDGEVKVRITHQELAHISGSSRVTVTKVLNDLRKQGILDKDKWQIIVKDKARLHKVARFESWEIPF